MTTTSTAKLLEEAVRRGSGVAAFNVITLEHAEAIVLGAEQAGHGVILQVSQNAVAYHLDALGPLAAALVEVAAAAGTPVALHLDHVEDDSLVRAAVAAGFSSVMVDAGHRPYVDNVAQTATATRWLHANGLSVEAELGFVGGKDTQPAGAHEPGVRTDPGQAADFVAATGVDALAVAVGSSHAMTSRTASLDLDLIHGLRERVPVPLVLHGSSGVPEADLRRAVQAGIVKVNIGTALNVAFTTAVRRHLAATDSVDPRKYLSAARTDMADVVSGLLEIISGR